MRLRPVGNTPCVVRGLLIGNGLLSLKACMLLASVCSGCYLLLSNTCPATMPAAASHVGASLPCDCRRFGRMPIYVLSCVGNIGACLGCMFSPKIQLLLVFRALQGGTGEMKRGPRDDQQLVVLTVTPH